MTEKIVVMGTGYVGLPLSIEFVRAGFEVTGIDTDGAKVEKLMRGESYIGDVPSDWLKEAVSAGASVNGAPPVTIVNSPAPAPSRLVAVTCRSSVPRFWICTELTEVESTTTLP